jgi:GDP-L-fucose synthase
MELRNRKVLLTGGAGFLGRHVHSKLIECGVSRECIFIPRSGECDLRFLENCINAVKGMDLVVHLAANSGGIGYSKEHQAEIYYDNLMMGTQILEASRREKIKKLLIVGTINSYPKMAVPPLKECDLWSGLPNSSTAAYGIAKRTLQLQAEAYSRQYGLNTVYLLLPNIYGPGATIDPKKSHLIPALASKILKAKVTGNKQVAVWGPKSVTRDFLYVEDAADGILLALKKYDGNAPVNLSSGTEITVERVAQIIKKLLEYSGELIWERWEGEVEYRRSLDSALAFETFGFRASTPFEIGVSRTVEWIKEQSGRTGNPLGAQTIGVT